MNSQKLLSFVLCLSSILISGCLRLPVKLALKPSKAPATVPDDNPTLSQGSLDPVYANYQYEIRALFIQKNYAGIDQEAGKDRVNKLRLPGGFWKLRALYGVFEAPIEGQGYNADWEKMIAQIKSWIKERPESVTARVALASAWKSYAWKARGDGYSGSVSESGWEKFRERLDLASQALAEAAKLNERCPHWYVVALWVGLGQGWDRDAFEKVFQAGVTFEPAYYYLYGAKTGYLLPRWHGKEGEWERFADESTQGPEGDEIFFAIYSNVLDLTGMEFMSTHQQAVPRLLTAFRKMEKQYGPSIVRTNEAALFASFGNDVATTVELFNRIGNTFDPEVWRSPKTFEVFRQAAHERARTKTVATKN